MCGQADNGRIEIRLMNEYGVEMPLWSNEGFMEGDEIERSDGLRADLESFADRWGAAISPEVSDDRWDGVPIMQSRVRARYSLDRLFHPSQQHAIETEQNEMRQIGEDLRVRLERELGSGYSVTHAHA